MSYEKSPSHDVEKYHRAFYRIASRWRDTRLSVLLRLLEELPALRGEVEALKDISIWQNFRKNEEVLLADTLEEIKQGIASSVKMDDVRVRKVLYGEESSLPEEYINNISNWYREKSFQRYRALSRACHYEDRREYANEGLRTAAIVARYRKLFFEELSSPEAAEAANSNDTMIYNPFEKCITATKPQKSNKA